MTRESGRGVEELAAGAAGPALGIVGIRAVLSIHGYAAPLDG
jgi:hypothetical protein